MVDRLLLCRPVGPVGNREVDSSPPAVLSLEAVGRRSARDDRWFEDE